MCRGKGRRFEVDGKSTFSIKLTEKSSQCSKYSGGVAQKILKFFLKIFIEKSANLQKLGQKATEQLPTKRKFQIIVPNQFDFSNTNNRKMFILI